MKKTSLLLFVLAIPCLTSCSKVESDPAITPSSQPLVSYKVTEIDSVLINPGVGFYRWNGNEQAPIKSIDRYARYNWTVFETSEGVYNFSSLRNEAELARTDPDGKGRFAFAFRCVVEGVDHAYPAYLDSKMTSWYSNTKKCWVPDWNNPYYLDRVDALVAALGVEFNNDPRIDYVEIRTFGNWGEWHLSGFETPPLPLTTITVPTIKRMIDAFVKAFPNKQIIMMSDQSDGLDYAMSQTRLKYPIGWRRDSWCNPQMPNLKNSSAWAKAANRWMTAPVVVEGYGNTGMTYSTAVSQVLDFNISSIGNGNFGDIWANLLPAAQQAYLLSAKTAGYRYVLRNVIADTLVAGKAAKFKSNWSNIGVAPAYLDWHINYRACNKTTGAVVWEAVSKLDLRTLLPTINRTTNVDSPITIEDSFLTPASLPSGEYNLEMLVTDASKYYDPLRIAIQGRKVNGAYTLGVIRIK